MNLHGKVAVVTGGSRGIGRGICIELGKAGASVVVNYALHKEAAHEVESELTGYGVKAMVYRADIAQKAEVDAMMEQVVTQFGGIDILVNNAGIAPMCNFVDVDEETWRQTLDVNLSGPFFCSQAAVRIMKDQGKGSIVNISTAATLRGGTEQVIHCAATKGGVNALTTTMARSLGKYGIRVNGILCGWVPTNINRAAMTDNEMVEKAIKALPLGKLGTPDDVAKAVAYLASDESDWVTGTLLAVDGGGLVV